MTRNRRVQPLRADNTSGFQGVCWHKHSKKWRAFTRLEGKDKTIGYYTTAQAAAEARTEYLKTLPLHPRRNEQP